MTKKHVSSINEDLKDHYTKINIENSVLKYNNNLINGNSTSASRKLNAVHRRHHSNPFIGPNTSRIDMDNISKTNLIKQDENSNLNNNEVSSINNTNQPVENLILKYKRPLVTFNRQKFSISPLQTQKEKFGMSNSNSNHFLIQGINNPNIRNKGIEGNRSEEEINEYGKIDIKFQIKSRQIQLPILYQESGFKKLNNYKSNVNLKRNINSVTPNKIVSNSQNLNNATARKDENSTIDLRSMKRFNYPSSTQILHNRVINKDLNLNPLF